MPKYRDFSEMPADKLRSLADDLASPVAAMKRIHDARCRHNDMLTDRVKGLPAQPDDGTHDDNPNQRGDESH